MKNRISLNNDGEHPQRFATMEEKVLVSSVLRKFNLRYESLRVAAILLILVMMVMLRRRMGFIMITRVKKYCKFSDDFY